MEEVKKNNDIRKIVGVVFDFIVYLWISSFILGFLGIPRILDFIAAIAILCSHLSISKRTLGHWFFCVSKGSLTTKDIVKICIGSIIALFLGISFFM